MPDWFCGPVFGFRRFWFFPDMPDVGSSFLWFIRSFWFFPDMPDGSRVQFFFSMSKVDDETCAVC